MKMYYVYDLYPPAKNSNGGDSYAVAIQAESILQCEQIYADIKKQMPIPIGQHTITTHDHDYTQFPEFLGCDYKCYILHTNDLPDTETPIRYHTREEKIDLLLITHPDPTPNECLLHTQL